MSDEEDPDSAAVSGLQKSWEERGGGTSKEDIEAYGAAAGCAAAAAYCTGEGAAALAPICCEIGGKVGQFVAGVVYSVGEFFSDLFGGGDCDWNDSSCAADNRWQKRLELQWIQRTQGLLDALIAARFHQLGAPVDSHGIPDPALSSDWNWSPKLLQARDDITKIFNSFGFNVSCQNATRPVPDSFHPYWYCTVVAKQQLGPNDAQMRLNLVLKVGLAWLASNAAIEEAAKRANGSVKVSAVLKNMVQSDAHLVIPEMAKAMAAAEEKKGASAWWWVALAGGAVAGGAFWLTRRHAH